MLLLQYCWREPNNAEDGVEGEAAPLSRVCLMLLANWDNTGAQPPSRFPSEVPSLVVCQTFQVFPHRLVAKTSGLAFEKYL